MHSVIVTSAVSSIVAFHIWSRLQMYKWVAFVSLVATVACFRQQAVAVKGKLMCGTAPAVNVRVKLWEEDDGK